MSKQDIKNTPVSNDQIPKGAYNTVGKQALIYPKSGAREDERK
ncbi:MAG TPA: hypothetical protein VD757_01280 [Candidatus Nitrosocosmicus sp.]|nr:hypothetical protein [Candidatus Nitrosocosmicus sp.]